MGILLPWTRSLLQSWGAPFGLWIAQVKWPSDTHWETTAGDTSWWHQDMLGQQLCFASVFWFVLQEPLEDFG